MGACDGRIRPRRHWSPFVSFLLSKYLVILVFLSGCPAHQGGVVRSQAAMEPADEQPVAHPFRASVQSHSKETVSDVVVQCPSPGPAKILGSLLDRYLKAGPGRLLSMLRVERFPQKGQGPFVGWRVAAVVDSCLARGIDKGDIVVAINRRSLERPSEFWRLWQELALARHLDLTLIHDGCQVVRRYEVVR